MTTWPDLAALEALVAVADHGSIAAAARATGMAQPNVSVSVARLERRFGTQLLHRSTTGARPTPSGLLVIEWTRPVLAAARVLTEGVASLGDGGTTLAVAASHTVAESLLPGWIVRLRAAHPDLAVGVDVCNSAEVAARLLAGTCDVGFVEGPRPPRGLRHRVVADDELVLVAPTGHPLTRRRRPVALAELATLPLVTREPGSGTRTALDHALEAQGLPAVSPVQVATGNAAVRVAVLSGAGLTVISRLVVQPAVDAGTLALVPLEVTIARPLTALWSGPSRPPPLVAELVRVAREGVPGSPQASAAHA